MALFVCVIYNHAISFAEYISLARHRNHLRPELPDVEVHVADGKGAYRIIEGAFTCDDALSTVRSQARPSRVLAELRGMGHLFTERSALHNAKPTVRWTVRRMDEGDVNANFCVERSLSATTWSWLVVATSGCA